MIPLSLLRTLIILLEYWDTSLLERTVRNDYWDALWMLKTKQLKIDINDAYTRLARALDYDTRHLARMEYLRLKNQLLEHNNF